MHEEQREGWARPNRAQKDHYFCNGRSVCNIWAYDGDLAKYDGSAEPRKEQCLLCFRALRARMELLANIEKFYAKLKAERHIP